MLDLRVASIRKATPATRVLRLALGGAPFPYRAGQAACLGLDDDRELVPYSIASAPVETRAHGWLEFLVKVDPTARFGAHVTDLRRGSHVSVDGPIGSFVLPEDPGDELLFVAGGTGIAPLRAMIRQAEANGRSRLRLLYVARSRRELAYLPELRALARTGRLDLTLGLTGDTPSRWRHARGRPGYDLLAPIVDGRQPRCFLCGPPGMITDLTAVLRTLGVPPDRIAAEGH
ncbi:MAG TPA: FAD-dependent oxidoreductase [Vicinamibacterales bacterium]|nr:FAD-dependent oxidoreductase [Vicinamibacterales bacterium]